MPNLIKFFITVIIIFSTFSSYSKDLNLPKNLVIYDKPKEYKDVFFKNRLNFIKKSISVELKIYFHMVLKKGEFPPLSY